MPAPRHESLTRNQVAALFGVSPHTVSRWAAKGLLPAVTTLGGHRRYPRSLIAELLRQQAEAAALS